MYLYAVNHVEYTEMKQTNKNKPSESDNKLVVFGGKEGDMCEDQAKGELESSGL